MLICYLGVLPGNTTFNAETAEAAAKNPSEALRALRALRSNAVISFHGVCPAHDDSVVNARVVTRHAIQISTQ